jgi:uroporphyrinogen-III synthase
LKIKNILISQPEPADIEKSPYNDLIKKFGVSLLFRKFFIIEPLPVRDFRKERINLLDYSAVIFNSRHAVDHYFRIAKEMRVEVPDSMKYFCVSESTAYYLTKYVQFRKRKIFHAKENMDIMLELFKKHKTEKFLLPCSDSHKQDIPHLLQSNKILYREACMYKTLPAELSDIDISKFDMLVFFSPSGIKSLFTNFPKFKQGKTLIGAFGESTIEAAGNAGLKISVPAPTQAAPSMTMAIELHGPWCFSDAGDLP